MDQPPIRQTSSLKRMKYCKGKMERMTATGNIREADNREQMGDGSSPPRVKKKRNININDACIWTRRTLILLFIDFNFDFCTFLPLSPRPPPSRPPDVDSLLRRRRSRSRSQARRAPPARTLLHPRAVRRPRLFSTRHTAHTRQRPCIFVRQERRLRAFLSAPQRVSRAAPFQIRGVHKVQRRVHQKAGRQRRVAQCCATRDPAPCVIVNAHPLSSALPEQTKLSVAHEPRA